MPPCPVDCIAMVPATGVHARWSEARADSARARYLARCTRLAQEASERAGRRAAAPRGAPTPEAKRAAIDAAIERARARRARFSRRGAR
jgi:electron transport complex protein RnfB